MTSPAPSAPGADAFAESDVAALRALQGANKLKPTFDNLVQVLLLDDRWQGVLAYDEFSGRYVKRRKPPFDSQGEEWMDADDLELRLWLAQQWSLRPRKDDLFDAVQTVAHRNRFHDVRAYLEALKHDGVPRVQRIGWLAAYLGAEDCEYSRLAGMKWLIGAVARILQPGCKMDYVLILEGKQGIGKSTALAVLTEPWFTDAPIRLNDREGWMVMRGRWVVELGELNSWTRAEDTAAKLFFGVRADRYRLPWGRRPIDVPRQCVFAATTNEAIYLRDQTGNRRYWPVAVNRADLPELRADREQLWAEAVALYRASIGWHVAHGEEPLFDDQSEARLVMDAWEGRIRKWLEENLDVITLSMPRLLAGALDLDPSKWTRAEQTRAGQVMTRVGWSRIRLRQGTDRERVWVRPGYEHRFDENGQPVQPH